MKKDNCTDNIRRNVHVNTMTDMKEIIFENTRLKKEKLALQTSHDAIYKVLDEIYDEFYFTPDTPVDIIQDVERVLGRDKSD